MAGSRRAGTTIDGGGGSTVYAQNDLAAVAQQDNSVPFGLLEGAALLTNVEKDQIITHDTVALKTDPTLYHLRKLQDTEIAPTPRQR